MLFLVKLTVKMKFLYKVKTIIFLLLFINFIYLFDLEEVNEKVLPYNRVKYLKEYKKELCIYLPAQELESTGPLSSILVQYGLNVKDFAEKFNKASNIYPAGLRIPVSIFYTMKEKRYDFCFRPLQLKILLEQYVEFDENRYIYKINLVDLYKVYLLKLEILNEKDPIKFKRNFFGTLRSFDYPLIVFFEDIDEETDLYYIKEFSLFEQNRINKYYVDDYEEEIIPEEGENQEIISEFVENEI